MTRPAGAGRDPGRLVDADQPPSSIYLSMCLTPSMEAPLDVTKRKEKGKEKVGADINFGC